MERLHKYLAEEGSPDSQLFLAIKLLKESAFSGHESVKNETAVDLLLESAISGNKTALPLLEQCLVLNVGITDKNRYRVLSCLSRNELDVQCDRLADTIMTTICDQQSRRLTQSEFRQSVRRLLQVNSPSVADKNPNIVDEKLLSFNVKLVLQHMNPAIDLTDDLPLRNTFTGFYNFLRLSLQSIDLSLMTSLLVMFCFSLFVNYFYFKPDFHYLYQNLNDFKTICLSLQLIQMFAISRVVDRIHFYNNYRLWVRLLKTVDKDLSIETHLFFNKSVFWTAVFLIVLAIELKIDLIFGSTINREPTLSSSVVRQLMALVLFLTLIKNNSNLIQIFGVIFHYFSLNYLNEIQTLFPFVDNFLTEYKMFLILFIAIITTRPLISSLSMNLILIPNLLTHLLLSISDQSSDSLSYVSENLSIHTFFATVLVIVLMFFFNKLYILAKFPRLLVINDFCLNLIKVYDFKTFLTTVLSFTILISKLSRLSFLTKFKLILTIFLSFLIFLQIVFFDVRQIRAMSGKTYPYDRYYDKCSDFDIDPNVTKQIECLDITRTNRLEALIRVQSVRVVAIDNRLKYTFDCLPFGLGRLLSISFLPFGFDLNEWNLFEYELRLMLKYSSAEVTVLLEHQNRHFLERLRIGDIYEIQMVYDSIKGTAVLLNAECKTCWDVFVWNNTIYV